MNSPRIQVSLPTNLKMPPRSPSRESVATEMSVSSSYLSECGWNSNKLPAHLSFLKAVPENQQLSAYLTPNRGPSPIPGGSGGGRFLRVPGASSVGVGGRSVDGGWWEEETDLSVIKNFSTLSKALGLQKSFSTGDIVSLDESGSPLHNNGTHYPPFFLYTRTGKRKKSLCKLKKKMLASFICLSSWVQGKRRSTLCCHVGASTIGALLVSCSTQKHKPWLVLCSMYIHVV